MRTNALNEAFTAALFQKNKKKTTYVSGAEEPQPFRTWPDAASTTAFIAAASMA